MAPRSLGIGAGALDIIGIAGITGDGESEDEEDEDEEDRGPGAAAVVNGT